MRQVALFAVGLFLLVGSLAATLGTVDYRDFELRGYVDATRDDNLPFMVRRPGVNVDLRQYDADGLRENLAMIQESGFVWVRQFVYWDEIEAEEGERDWSRMDEIMDAVHEFPQLEPVVVLTHSPEWARVTREGAAVMASGPPSDMGDFAAFASAFAARYGDVVNYYQIWDEPNLDDAWGMLDPRPSEYVALLGAGAGAIRGVDAGAKILAAALAPTTEVRGANISDLRFLDAMYRYGAAEMMDIVAGKPYGFSTSPLDRRVDEGLLNFSRVVALREVMLSHGDGRRPLWASHWGWNALPDGWGGDKSIWGSATEEEQIRFTLQAYDRAHREFPWLGAMILHHWQPNAGPDSAQWGFALVNQEGAATPLLLAIQGYDFPSRGQNGLFHARNRHARYSGVWQFSALGADIGWLETSDSQLEFDYYGRDIAMLLREDDYVAFLYPTVDGEPANATPQDSNGNAYVFLRSDSHGPELNLVPIAREMALAPHTLSAVADRGWDRWAIAGYAVSSGDLSAPFNRQIAIGAVLTALSLVIFVAAAVGLPWRRWVPALGVVLSGFSATAHLALGGAASVAMMLVMLWTWPSHRPAVLAREEVNMLLAIATTGAFLFTPNILLTIVAGVALFVLIYHRLETGLILTLFWAPFFLKPLELYQFAFPIVEVMMLTTALAAALRCLVWHGEQRQIANRAYPLRIRSLLSHLNTVDMALIGMALVAAVSLVWTGRMDVAVTELRVLIIEPLLFYVIFRALRPDRRTILHGMVALVVSAGLVCVIGLLCYFGADGSIEAEEGTRRLISVYGSPNNVALLLGRVIPIILAFVLGPIHRWARFMGGAVLLIMGVTLLLTQSAGAILLGLPAGVVIVLIGRYRWRSLGPIAGMGIVTAVGFAVLTQISARFANVLDFSSGTNFLRLRLWESAIEVIRDHPITGIGLDQFLYRFSGTYVRPDAIWNLDLSHPHNFILDFWTRLGVAGPLIFFVIQLYFWRVAAATLRRFRLGDPVGFAMTLGLLGSMAATLAHGLVDNSVFVIDLAFIFAFQLAAMLRLYALAKSSVE